MISPDAVIAQRRRAPLEDSPDGADDRGLICAAVLSDLAAMDRYAISPRGVGEGYLQYTSAQSGRLRRVLSCRAS